MFELDRGYKHFAPPEQKPNDPTLPRYGTDPIQVRLLFVEIDSCGAGWNVNGGDGFQRLEIDYFKRPRF
jgi:hypothetical protein